MLVDKRMWKAARWASKENLHDRETSIADYQGGYPSFGENPLMKETSMANL